MAKKVFLDECVFKKRVHFQDYVKFRHRELLLEEIAQPNPAEPSGGTWHKVLDPTTGFKVQQTSGWAEDSFTGGLEVDFSAEVPAGTKAVKCFMIQETTLANVYARKSGDTNISNTPHASSEVSHMIIYKDYGGLVELWLSSDYKVQIAVSNTGSDIYIAYPIEYLL